MSDIAPGTVAILHQGQIHSDLDDWRAALPPQVRVVKVRGNQIARQRNLASERMHGGWLLFVDADVVPPFDALPRLLSHDVPIVSGVVHERFPPFDLCLTKALEPLARWRIDEIPRTGLLRVLAAGTGCLMIRRAVLEAVAQPWFRCGQIIPDLLMEDTEFCLRAGEAGFQTYADCDVRPGHEVTAILRPGRDGKMWVEWPGPGNYMVPVPLPHETAGR